MDPDNNSLTAIIEDEDTRKENIKKIINGIIFIGTMIGHIVTICLGIPMFERCYNVALLVMIVGSVLGLIQQVAEFFRNFVKLKMKTQKNVNVFFGLIITIRICWLIASTIVITKSQCDSIIQAWICIYINWGLLVLMVILISIVITLKKLGISFYVL